MSDTLKIHDYLDAHFQENLEEMRRFLAQPGFSHTGEGVRETAEMALGYVKSLNPAEAELVETDGNPVVYAKVLSKKPNAKTLIAYSLYDVVPVVEEDWTFPPLGGTITDAEKIGVQPHLGKVLVSRGTHNQRGPMLAFVQVLKAYQAVTGDIPVNVLFAWEGEEEIGCPHLLQFIQKKLDVLKTADAFYMPSMRDDEDGNLIVNRGYKGKLNVEIEIKGGEWGGRPRRKIPMGREHGLDRRPHAPDDPPAGHPVRREPAGDGGRLLRERPGPTTMKTQKTCRTSRIHSTRTFSRRD